MRSLVLLLLFCTMTAGLNICQRTSTWRLSGKTFPKDFPARVKFVALLRASCGFCRVQAVKYI